MCKTTESETVKTFSSWTTLVTCTITNTLLQAGDNYKTHEPSELWKFGVTSALQRVVGSLDPTGPVNRIAFQYRITMTRQIIGLAHRPMNINIGLYRLAP